MTKSPNELNPRTKHYEFGGPLGALFVTLSVPIITYVLYFTCSETSGGCPPLLQSLPTSFTEAVTNRNWWKSLWDMQAFLAYIAWWAFCVVAWFVLPGDWVEGTTMRNGRKLKYKINGMVLPCLLLSAIDSVGYWCSLFDLPSHPRSCLRRDHSVWPWAPHLHLRALDRSRYRLRGIRNSTSYCCIHWFIPGREAPRSRWQHWECHL